MTLYWLSRSGADPQGPLLPSQLRIMRAQGAITPEDFVCVDGTQDWQPVSSVLGDQLPSDTPVVHVKKHPTPHQFSQGDWMPEEVPPAEQSLFMKVLVAVAILACLATVLYAVFAPMLKPIQAPDRQLLQREVVQHWAVETFRDPSARLQELGESLKWYDGDLRLARVLREGVSHNYVLQFAWGTGQVTAWWTPTEWSERFRDTEHAVTYADTTRIILGSFDEWTPGSAKTSRAEGLMAKP